MARDSGEMTERAILELLLIRYAAPEWASFVQVNKGTGALGGSWIDFFGLNVYPGRAWHAIACEVKTSRADFLRELKQPQKRAWAEALCNETFFVAPSGVAKPAELPEGWGLIELTAAGLRIKRPAPYRQRELAWPPEFVASLLRRAADDRPRLPAAFWTHCGRELDEETLEQLVEHRASQRIREARREGADEERKRAAAQAGEDAAIAATVRDCLPYPLDEPGRLRAFLINAQDRDPALVKLLQGASGLQAALGRFLEGQ